MRSAILAIDQGTTNSKAILLSPSAEVIARGSASVGISHPRPGWVEQDPDAVWQSQLAAISACLAAAGDVRVEAIGISNQRESVLAWDRRTGRPVGPLVSWQCRRTADACATLQRAGHGPEVMARTGLPLDPMFPATKLRWLVEHCAAGHDPAGICLGTVDSWLIWNLSGGTIHATDASNASRTQLLNLARAEWDADLLSLFGIDSGLLPRVRDSAAPLAVTRGIPGLPDGTPVASAIGDSHAALFSHGAFTPGDGKVTFGTGSSVMATIPAFRAPPDGLTTAIAWSLSGQPTYAFEGNILVSAAILPWTAQLLGLPGVDALMDLARSVPDSLGVSLVPAHVGLGAPHWSTEARGLISGLSFGAGPAHVARAAAESIALQVADVFRAMGPEAARLGRLFADGGPSQNPFLMQIVADHLQRPLSVRDAAEASAMGAGFLAGLATGVWPDLAAIQAVIPPAHAVPPSPPDAALRATRAAWDRAISRALQA